MVFQKRKRKIMLPVGAWRHSREAKSGANVSQECMIHSRGSKEVESAADGIKRKPKKHNPERIL